MENKKYDPCGGCGAEKPIDRCIGCFHPFRVINSKEVVEWLNLASNYTEDWQIMHCRYSSDGRKLDTDLFEEKDGGLVKIGGTGRLEFNEVEYMTAASAQQKDKGPGAVWVKVSDRLPEGGQIVMLYKDGLFLIFCKFWPVGFNGNDEAVFIGMDNKGPYGLDEVTHWAPLPVGPDESTSNTDYQQLKEDYERVSKQAIQYADSKSEMQKEYKLLKSAHDRLKDKAEKMEKALKLIEQMSHPGSYERAVYEMKSIASDTLNNNDQPKKEGENG